MTYALFHMDHAHALFHMDHALPYAGNEGEGLARATMVDFAPLLISLPNLCRLTVRHGPVLTCAVRLVCSLSCTLIPHTPYRGTPGLGCSGLRHDNLTHLTIMVPYAQTNGSVVSFRPLSSVHHSLLGSPQESQESS
jgi:hypothetical protein